ncbi:MAG: aldo/keto reductase [Candidatus Latescibacterota bacterium]
MRTRPLGKTGLNAGIVGLGTEYLHQRPRETVVSVVREAILHGVNYMDFVFTFPEYLDHLGAALKGQRDKVIITGHLGSAGKNGHYRKTRNLKECEGLFLQMLSRLRTEHVDVLFLQFVDEAEDYERMMGPGGLLELALRFQREGKARFIGLSGHHVPVALSAVQSGIIDVLMFPINLTSDGVLEEKELFRACAGEGVGLVAMKPFAGGKLLQKNEARSLTPVQCLSYTLSQMGVSCAVPGVKDLGELEAALHFLDATSAEKDFSAVLTSLPQHAKGACVYCNHCLPCPALVDIGQTIRLFDLAQAGVSEDLRAEYRALSVKASACTECGSCARRCPFGVDVISKMQQATGLFETNASA